MPKRTRFEDLRELSDEVAALREEVAEFRALLQEKERREAEAAAVAEASPEEVAPEEVAPAETPPEEAPPEEAPPEEAPPEKAEAAAATGDEASPAAKPEETCTEKELLAAINNPDGCMERLELIVGARQVNKRSLLERILEAKAEQPEGRFDDYEQIKEAVKGLGDRTMASLRRKWSRA